jgi:hypothetical protein
LVYVRVSAERRNFKRKMANVPRRREPLWLVFVQEAGAKIHCRVENGETVTIITPIAELAVDLDEATGIHV